MDLAECELMEWLLLAAALAFAVLFGGEDA